MAELERAGAAFGVHSNWGESGPGWEPQGHYKKCGFEVRSSPVPRFPPSRLTRRLLREGAGAGAGAGAGTEAPLGHPDLILGSAWDCIHLGGPAAHALHGGFRERSERSWGATLGAATGRNCPRGQCKRRLYRWVHPCRENATPRAGSSPAEGPRNTPPKDRI